MTDLTKWPLLLVTGDPVTEQQANEILIRTDSWTLSTNDREWEAAAWSITGLVPDRYGRPGWSAVNSFCNDLGVLNLSYLANERITSAWIGGPHGWCDWDGTIGTANYNIGKWPGVDDVTGDWTEIAEAFPYLNLRAQLIPDEGEAAMPAVEWRIANGSVQTDEAPTRMLRRPHDPQLFTLFQPGRERGVSLERLALAMEQVRGASA